MGVVPTFTGIPTQSDLHWQIASRPLAYLYQTTAQTGIASSTWTQVQLQTALIDRDTGHVGTSSRYTIGITLGWYWVSGVVAFAGGGGTTRAARLVVNGTPVDGSLIELPGDDAMTVAIPPTPVQAVSVGDYVELQCLHNSGIAADLTVNAGLCSQMFVEFAGT